MQSDCWISYSHITQHVPGLKYMDVTWEYFVILIHTGSTWMEALMLSFKANIVPHPITKNWAEHSAISVQSEFVHLWALIIPQLGFKEDILKESKGVQHAAHFCSWDLSSSLLQAPLQTSV